MQFSIRNRLWVLVIADVMQKTSKCNQIEIEFINFLFSNIDSIREYLKSMLMIMRRIKVDSRLMDKFENFLSY